MFLYGDILPSQATQIQNMYKIWVVPKFFMFHVPII